VVKEGTSDATFKSLPHAARCQAAGF